MKGTDLYSVQEIGGRKSLNMIHKYEYLNQEHERQAIKIPAENSSSISTTPAEIPARQNAVNTQKRAPIAQLDRASAF